MGIFRKLSGDNQLHKLSGDWQVWSLTSARHLSMTNGIWQSLGIHLVNINVCMQNSIIIFHSVQKIGPFSLVKNSKLGKASTDDKCRIATWCRSCQYQSVCKSLSKYSNPLKGCGHFSRTVRRRTCVIIGHNENRPSTSLSDEFLRVVQCNQTRQGCINFTVVLTDVSARQWKQTSLEPIFCFQKY